MQVNLPYLLQKFGPIPLWFCARHCWTSKDPDRRSSHKSCSGHSWNVRHRITSPFMSMSCDLLQNRSSKQCCTYGMIRSKYASWFWFLRPDCFTHSKAPPVEDKHCKPNYFLENWGWLCCIHAACCRTGPRNPRWLWMTVDQTWNVQFNLQNLLMPRFSLYIDYWWLLSIVRIFWNFKESSWLFEVDACGWCNCTKHLQMRPLRTAFKEECNGADVLQSSSLFALEQFWIHLHLKGWCWNSPTCGACALGGEHVVRQCYHLWMTPGAHVRFSTTLWRKWWLMPKRGELGFAITFRLHASEVHVWHHIYSKYIVACRCL